MRKYYSGKESKARDRGQEAIHWVLEEGKDRRGMRIPRRD